MSNHGTANTGHAAAGRGRFNRDHVPLAPFALHARDLHGPGETPGDDVHRSDLPCVPEIRGGGRISDADVNHVPLSRLWPSLVVRAARHTDTIPLHDRVACRAVSGPSAPQSTWSVRGGRPA
jgi:hypothetical protein